MSWAVALNAGGRFFGEAIFAVWVEEGRWAGMCTWWWWWSSQRIRLEVHSKWVGCFGRMPISSARCLARCQAGTHLLACPRLLQGKYDRASSVK